MSLRASRKSAFFIAIAAALTVGSAASAEDVPLNLQAVLFKKIMSFDQTLEGKVDPKLLIVHPDDAGEEVEAVMKAFKAAGLNVSATKLGGFSAALPGAQVVYAMGSAANGALKEQCAKQQLLLVSGSASHAVNGQVAISLGTKADGKPEIIVNLGLLKAQGHRMSSSLLNLARVIQ